MLGYVQITEVSARAAFAWGADGAGVGPSDRACGRGSGDHQWGVAKACAPGRSRSGWAAGDAVHEWAGGASGASPWGGAAAAGRCDLEGRDGVFRSGARSETARDRARDLVNRDFTASRPG